MEVFDAQAVTHSELQRIRLLWRESGDADLVNGEVLRLCETLTRETGYPVHVMQRPIPDRGTGVVTISVNGSRVGSIDFPPVRFCVRG